MICCENLVHPFQNDPGVSQRQRVIEDLLSGSAKIDGRKIADLLDYFTQLSKHINFYDRELNVKDWQAFFRKSIPFSLSDIIRHNEDSIQQKFDRYNKLFDKRPNRQSLQLITHFIYSETIYKVKRWHDELKGSELPVERLLEKLIRDKLHEPVKKFICLTNTAVQKYHIRKIDFNKLQEAKIWELNNSDLRDSSCFVSTAPTKRKRLIALRNEIASLFPGFLNIIGLIGPGAELSMDLSLLPLKQEFREKHSPHLALLFAFLKLFNYLQNDLNGFTKKHLDFFYQKILKLKPRDAVSDKAHILFEIQNQLDKYLIKKGIQVKDGKDLNKAEINFALDDEIVVNRAAIADVRTLFLNQNIVHDTSYVEGVYMAPNALKADGIDIDFTDKDPKNWPTLGAKFSKYTDPEQKFIKPYPDARIGFVLASPVLYLKEGKRTVKITLDCELHNDYCKELKEQTTTIVRKNCCEETPPVVIDAECQPTDVTPIPACKLYNDVQAVLNSKFYYVSKERIKLAIKKGLSANIIKRLFDLLTETKDPLCFCPEDVVHFDRTVPEGDFIGIFPNPGELELLKDIFPVERPLKIRFSGEKDWIEPSELTGVKISPKVSLNPTNITCVDNQDEYDFTITIEVTLDPDKEGVVFFNSENLKEELNTTDPLVKIELNDHIKLAYRQPVFKTFIARKFLDNPVCCLENPVDIDDQKIALYHFFRNVILNDAQGSQTAIDVTVCGLKNFVVQHDSTLMDINGPIYPFGPTPDIVDFDLDHTTNQSAKDPTLPNPMPNPLPNLVGPNFYIGSREVLLKNWQKICLKMNWKNKPVNFNEYYKAYLKRDIPTPTNPLIGLDERDFQVNLALLEDGTWGKEKSVLGKNALNPVTTDFNRKLFPSGPACATGCGVDTNFTHSFFIESTDFNGARKFGDITKDILEYKTDTRNGFIRLNLQNQDFLHHDYSIALARQMMAMGKFPDKGVEGAIYYGSGNTVLVFHDTGSKIVTLDGNITALKNLVDHTRKHFEEIDESTKEARKPDPPGTDPITNAEFTTSIVPGNPSIQSSISFGLTDSGQAVTQATNAVNNMDDIKKNLTIFDFLSGTGKLKDDLAVPIPNEPWTPIIENIQIDYEAKAVMKDIKLIHLYPFENTYKHEDIEHKPSLFPTHCAEGTLFLGLQDFVPGSTLNVLFQLAEATADSESVREELQWYYLDSNEWKSLRDGFEVLDDATDGLTTSGIVKLSLPANMTKDNTILSKGLHWIKVSIPRNSRAVAETIGIHTQAILTTFTNDPENDKLRLGEPLAAGQISKLTDADPLVKTVIQPYDSFGGREPEVEKHYYTRVSEVLRHKGRAIQKWDYERIVLEQFPTIFKAKCINHSFALDAKRFHNDFPVAPGYVLLAVIPDMKQLKAGNSFEPKAPVSLLDDIETYIKTKTSPFVRLRAMNPRYERVDICLKVKLQKGKDEVYYREKLKEDIYEFLAPWSIGEYSKLSFGQCVNRSDLLRFIEGLEYVDYILLLSMMHERDSIMKPKIQEICPRTPRSILIGGDIDICIKQDDCEDWEKCRDDAGNYENCCKNEKIPVSDFCKPPIVIV